PALLDEARPHLGADLVEYFLAVCNGRLTATFRRRFAIEENLLVESAAVRVLVVQEDRLISGVVGRSVNLAAHLCPRRRALIVIEQVMRDHPDELLELFGRVHAEV